MAKEQRISQSDRPGLSYCPAILPHTLSPYKPYHSCRIGASIGHHTLCPHDIQQGQDTISLTRLRSTEEWDRHAGSAGGGGGSGGGEEAEPAPSQLTLEQAMIAAVYICTSPFSLSSSRRFSS
jgi:hypothetical protein